jgi:hypothetical protein
MIIAEGQINEAAKTVDLKMVRNTPNSNLLLNERTSLPLSTPPNDTSSNFVKEGM